MRKLISLLIFAALALPASAVKHIAIQQFDQALADAKNKPDVEVARWLTGLDLTERVSNAQLTRWRDAMPGPESKRTLTMLADASAFLRLPPGEILQAAPLEGEGQQQVLALASVYVDATLAKLPNFFAAESITTFEDTPASQDFGNYTVYQPLHYADFKRATVLYQGGKEVMETRSKEISEQDQTITLSAGLLSSGEFGPVLHTVLTDAHNGKLTWSHWESDGASKAAVFRYSVPRKQSHYRVKVELAGHSQPWQTRPGYHGEITIDPGSGTILRITLQADLIDDDPMKRSDLMVEYGLVEIGNQSYTCPVRSVTMTLSYSRKEQIDDTGTLRRSQAQVQTMLNDARFDHYHVLRSEARVLTGADMGDDENKPDLPQ